MMKVQHIYMTFVNTDLVTKAASLAKKVPEHKHRSTTQEKEASPDERRDSLKDSVDGMLTKGKHRSSSASRHQRQRYKKRRDDRNYERDENKYHTEDSNDCSSESSDESSDVEEAEWRREQKRKTHRCSSSMKSKEHWQRTSQRPRNAHSSRIQEAIDAACRNEELYAMLNHSNYLLKMNDRRPYYI